MTLAVFLMFSPGLTVEVSLDAMSWIPLVSIPVRLSNCLANSQNSNFMAVSVIPEETVTELIALLKDPATQRAIMLGNNKDPLALINRGVPKPLYDETAVFADPAELDTPLQIEMEDDGIEEEDEREMNTDLDEADEAWVRSHKDS